VIVPLRFRLQSPSDLSIDFIVDTGFTGHLCLPQDAVDALQLPFRYDLRANLADNSSIVLPVYDGVVLWNGTDTPVEVLATGIRPLIGTALLDGFELIAQFRENRHVSIERLDQPSSM
jgi:clan AA aspartic protease